MTCARLGVVLSDPMPFTFRVWHADGLCACMCMSVYVHVHVCVCVCVCVYVCVYVCMCVHVLKSGNVYFAAIAVQYCLVQ